MPSAPITPDILVRRMFAQAKIVRDPHAQQRRPLLSDIGPFGFLGVEFVFYIVSCKPT